MVDSVFERLHHSVEVEVVVAEIDQLLLPVLSVIVVRRVERVRRVAQVNIREGAFVVELLGHCHVLFGCEVILAIFKPVANGYLKKVSDSILFLSLLGRDPVLVLQAVDMHVFFNPVQFVSN